MAVPAHDSRDHEFALKYAIPIIRVVSPFDESCDLGEPYLGDGVMVNSSNSLSGLNVNGLSCKDAALEVINWLERTGYGKKKVCFIYCKFIVASLFFSSILCTTCCM